MSRISRRLGELASRGEGALVAYVMAGYPDRGATVSAVRGLVRGGADVVELGFPFSDPLADGPVIQNAGAASLEGGTTAGGFFDMVGEIRAETDVPLALMTYTNVLHRRGYRAFISRAARAGIDGFILPDMPVEEAGEYRRAAAGRADTVFLVSPNTAPARIRKIAAASTGFLYLVAVYGTTGGGSGATALGAGAVRRVKEAAGGGIPVGVGFGVSSPGDVRRYVRAGADAVVVGSAFLRLIGGIPRSRIESRVASFAGSLKAATR